MLDSRARRDRSAAAGDGKPEPLDVPAGEGHGGIETNDGKEPSYLENGLDHLLADRRAQVVQLGGVVPGKAGAVVTVINVLDMSGGVVAAAKDHGGVGLLVVVIFNLDFDAVVG